MSVSPDTGKRVYHNRHRKGEGQRQGRYCVDSLPGGFAVYDRKGKMARPGRFEHKYQAQIAVDALNAEEERVQRGQ